MDLNSCLMFDNTFLSPTKLTLQLLQVNTNFEGADVRGASFEDTSMDNANLRNINAAGSYFGQSLLDVESMEGGDFTDAQIPVKTLKLICQRDDVKGTNTATGVKTRESLMCL